MYATQDPLNNSNGTINYTEGTHINFNEVERVVPNSYKGYEGGTAEETKTWSDQILDYVPVVVEGIIAFVGTILALKLSTKKVTISMNDLTNAKDNFSSVSLLS